MDNRQALLDERNLSKLRTILSEMQPADLALYFEELAEEDLDDFPVVFRLLPKNLAAETFAYMDIDLQQTLIEVFSDKELTAMTSRMALDDVADTLDELPANLVDRVLRQVPRERREQLNRLLDFPDDSAGSIMSVDYIDLRPQMTVEDAISRIRNARLNSDTVYTCYVTDLRKLIGVVSLRTLLVAEPDELISDVMEPNVISVYTHEDKEQVADVLSKYDFSAIPVVDNDSRLVGIITFDDVIDVIRNEATEDMEKMAAIVPAERPYLKTSVFSLFAHRIPWLLLLMVSATFTGKILAHFEDALQAQIVLTMFIPMLMDTGGNAGGQASVTIIRGLSLNEISIGDILRILWKEIRVALLCGTALAAAAFAKMIFLDQVTVAVALTVSLTMIAVVAIAKIVGCSLPLLAKAIKLDPAVVASPFITTIVDALALLVYFAIASRLLGI